MGFLKKVFKATPQGAIFSSLNHSGTARFFGGAGAGFSSLAPGGILDTLTGKDSMREQNDWNLQMWNMQNAYNTPLAQMQRYQEAGLNPNLIYGQQNTAGPVHASAGPMESGASALSKIFSTVQAVKSLKMLGAQVANMQQQNENLKSQDTLLGANAEYVRSQTRMQELKNKYFQSTGRLPRSEGSLGASVGDFFRYMDWLTPSNKENGTQVPSHINDKNMFHVWYNSMRKKFERNNRLNGRRESDVTYIKSRW